MRDLFSIYDVVIAGAGPVGLFLARGFLPRGLSYACRRPKLFTEADRLVLGRECDGADIQVDVGNVVI
jgi:threonine dehydrogenase-like Zn-dependent dehydrogenase